MTIGDRPALRSPCLMMPLKDIAPKRTRVILYLYYEYKLA